MSPDEYLSMFKDCEDKAYMNKIIRRLRDIMILRRLSSEEKDKLTKLRSYASAQLQFEQLKVELEAFTNLVNAEYKDLTEGIIPGLMDELEIPYLGISETQKIEVQNKINASLSKGNADKGCDWLIENGQGAIVKKEVGYKFATTETELADKVIAAMKEAGVIPSVARTVHHSTLSAYVRNALEEGVEVPLDLLGVFQRRASTITEKK